MSCNAHLDSLGLEVKYAVARLSITDNGLVMFLSDFKVGGHIADGKKGCANKRLP